MRRLTGLFIFMSGLGVAGAAMAQQPQPQPTTTGGVQPLPPPTVSASSTALPTMTTQPPPPPPPTATATATVIAPPPPPPTATATATVVAPPPPPPPPTATATATDQLPPPPLPTATTTTPPPPPPPTATTLPPPPPPITVIPRNARRDDGEMAFLYATSAAFGLTTGAWIDTLSLCSPDNKQKNQDGTLKLDPQTGKTINQCDPAGALVSPLLLGTLFPLGFFLWDNFYKGGIHRGVPSSISTGLIIGALEGLGVAGANFAVAGDDPNRWGSNGIMTSVFVGSALGGIGGYAFGEFVRPDPRKIALVASGAGWGALMGSTFGGGVANSDGNSVAQGMLVGNLVGINVGVITTGVLAAAGYDPSWQSLKYMWLGAGIGLLGTSAIIYPIYLATGQQDQTTNCGDPSNRHGCPLVNHGMVANSFGMLAGVVIAGILTRDLKDPEPVPVPDQAAPPPPGSPPGTLPPPGTAKREKEKTWRPPFMFSLSPTQNGGMMSISGQW